MGLADDIINSKNSKSTNDETKINKVNLTQKQDKLINDILNVSTPKIKRSSNTMNLNSKIKDNNLITNKNSNDVNKYTSDGYRITNKKYGDYFYQNYATDKDKPIVEKDGYYYIFDENSNGNGRYKSVDSMNFMTTKEADKQQYEEAQKQGYIGSNNTDLKKISNQIKLDTVQLSEDEKEEYKNNSLLQDKLLWVAREYKKQGIKYAEISVTWIVRKGEEGAKILKELHEILPHIEKETGVKLRFLGSLSRTLMTEEQLKEGVDVLKVAAKSPYIVGSDIIGEEINDIRNFKQVIKELVEFAVRENNGFTIRIHAGENDSFRENVERAVSCVKESVPEGYKMPKCRIGHGLYGINLDTKEGIDLMHEMKKDGVVLEFQLTSNVRLNNLTQVEKHPIKQYLSYGVNCVQGSDGCGFYGTDCMEEQMALTNLLNLTEEDLMKMRKVEDKIIKDSDKYFKIKSQKFEEWLERKRY